MGNGRKNDTAGTKKKNREVRCLLGLEGRSWANGDTVKTADLIAKM